MITLSKKLKQPPESPKNKKVAEDITKRISIRDKLLVKGKFPFGSVDLNFIQNIFLRFLNFVCNFVHKASGTKLAAGL